MGFWSAVGSVCSSVASFGSAVAGAVGRGISAACTAAKDVAGRAVGWIAEKAEGFVDGAKMLWGTVKPYVDKIRATLKTAAESATAAGLPWLGGALLLLDGGLGALTKFENSPIAKFVSQAIDWAIQLANRWKRNKLEEKENKPDRLNDEELQKARRHQENLRFAEREIVSDEQKHQLELAAVFNDYEIASTDLANTLDKSPENFEHYLRLRASQKLLAMADEKFRTAKTVDDLTSDDVFIVRISSDLMKPNPELSNQAALRLDRLLTEKYGKKLLPFVFEELIASWAKRAEVLDKQWHSENKSYAKDVSLRKYLLNAKEIQIELSEEERSQLEILESELPKKKAQLDELATCQRDIERYVGASEGLLQVLEKSPETIEAEDRAYLLEESQHVGKLLIECAENDKKFSDLNTHDQLLMTDYANIFKNESKVRMKNILEITA